MFPSNNSHKRRSKKIRTRQKQNPPELPATGFARLPVVLRAFPISRSGWWAGVKSGRFPKPVKLGPRITVWKAEDVHALIARYANQSGKKNRGTK